MAEKDRPYLAQQWRNGGDFPAEDQTNEEIEVVGQKAMPDSRWRSYPAGLEAEPGLCEPEENRSTLESPHYEESGAHPPTEKDAPALGTPHHEESGAHPPTERETPAFQKAQEREQDTPRTDRGRGGGLWGGAKKVRPDLSESYEADTAEQTPFKSVHPATMALPRERHFALFDQEGRQIRQKNIKPRPGVTPGHEGEVEIRCPSCSAIVSSGEMLCSNKRCRLPLCRIDSLEICKEIGRGGMGVVYLARQSGNHQERCVIKTITPPADRVEEFYKKFLVEILALYNLSLHPHIVKIYDVFGEIEGLGYYYVMEYLEGKTLEQILQEGERLELDIALHILFQICEALSATHQNASSPIVHRDLKSANIFILEKEEDPYFVKVVDFGIARLQEDKRPGEPEKSEKIEGTPEYMAPEQWQGLPVDPRTDQYALAIILHQMLSGKLPLPIEYVQGQSPQSYYFAAACQHLSARPLRLTDHVPDNPKVAPFEEILLKALEKKPEDRFESIAAFKQAIFEARTR